MSTINRYLEGLDYPSTKQQSSVVVHIAHAEVDKQYRIKKIDTDDIELRNFLFSLGCYEGESITLISTLSETCVVAIKDARYSIDQELAECIMV